MDGDAGSARAIHLADKLREAASAVIATIAQTAPEHWGLAPGPGVWSIGKDVEHVIEAAAYHQWIVRRTIGDRVSSRRPVLERARLTTELSPREAIHLVQARTEEGAALLMGLTDAQLDLPTVPPRARSQRLEATIESVLIAHYDAHRRDIEAKQKNRAPDRGASRFSRLS